MKKCCSHKRPDRESHVMGSFYDIGKLMKAKANNSAFKEGQSKDLAKVSSSKQPGGK
jgi:hypothetical protein